MLPSIFKACVPKAEIQSGNLSAEIFAAKLISVVEGNAPYVYQNADAFFANTYPTDGLKTLIKEVFSRLNKSAAGAPVIRLETSFGGGKTHDEIAIWHICQTGRKIQGLERFTDLNLIPNSPIQVAAVDGRDLDPENGIFRQDAGFTTYTLWGEIAYQIGGIAGYELLSGSDKKGISPGTSVLKHLINGNPTVIILDEIAHCLRTAKAKVIGNSDLAEQVVAFLFTLMDLAGASDNIVFVYSLASISDTFSQETTELKELISTEFKEVISASARQELIISPSTDVEVYNIVKQRLFDSVSAEVAEKVSTQYLKSYRACKLNLPDGCKDADYASAIAQSYPFHPELFNLLTKKIASIPEFQKTRGALRLFAQVVKHLWQNPTENIPMIHTHHIPVGMDDDVTNDLTSRLKRSQMIPPIRADIYNTDGRKAYAQVQDENWIAAGKPPFTTWTARTIFLHSLTQGTSSGINKSELNLSLLTPGIEIGFVERALEKLTSVAWYLDYDPITSRSRFKEEPSINKIVTEEKDMIGIIEAKEYLRKQRDTIFAKRIFNSIPAPASPSEVDDKPDEIALCLIDFDEALVKSTTDNPPEIVDKIFNNTGESGKFRVYRNRLLFLVANKIELEKAVDNAREYKAIQNILKSQNRLQDLSETQQQQLNGRAKDIEVRISLTSTYRHLFYPSNDPKKAPNGLMHYTLPTQDASTIKGKSNQQDVIVKALKDCQKFRSEEEAKPYDPAFILQKVWSSGLDSISTKGIKEAFAKDLSLKFLMGREISLLRDTIVKGVQEGKWDMKVGERLFIKTELGLPSLPNIEFSDNMVLYRRGILEPPAPKIIELNAQVMQSREAAKPVRVRWKAKGALTVTLYQDNDVIPGNFKPSDEYETTITEDTVFKVIADYGNDETESKEYAVTLTPAISVSSPTSTYQVPGKSDSEGTQGDIFDFQPPNINLEGTVNTVLTKFGDECSDRKVATIESLELTVDKAVDYRKIGTALPLLSRLNISIDQTVTIQAPDQFVRFEYQGKIRGFQSFFTTISGLLNVPNAQADVNLKITIEFPTPITPGGHELNAIKQALTRNPVERISLSAKVTY
ncbi:MAG: ATP-binding protein [Okeania sp. SIO2C2]|uniref:ATP-binding protein n=1 Tax=Okeania sp. SIO2C2 TaxID=2607787 RepID=UPI0013B7DC7E|nr:DUF499 domain-containing protein [Okeania sp. SIO2C2]NEP85621.1 ATP-binding protein [Okeania sp. SIO2C2]